MDWIVTGALGFIAAGWLAQSFRAGIGMGRLPRMRRVEPLSAAACPPVSLLFAARDEEERLPRALATFRAQDCPGLQIVAVDDRSTDGTAEILDRAAAGDERVEVLHVTELPSGWLGKTHALQRAYERSTGEWLLFTDADVRLAPDVIRRALALASRDGLDHLTLIGHVDMFGFWEKVAILFFAVGFTFYSEAWKVSNPRSRAYCGVGAFQLIRRSTYEAIGTHRRLSMEVIDDMKLGKLVKENGFRSAVGFAEEAVAVRWHAGLGNIIRGTTKNLFAGAGYRLPFALLQLVLVLAFDVLPFVAPLFASPAGTALALVSAGIACITLGAGAHSSGVSALYGLTVPLGALILSYMMLRSTVVTLVRGGVRWRETFYPLAELRRGLV